MPTALALSGGGAKGDFQVGALRYLFQTGVRPDIIAGSSVGAINGLKLAEGESETDATQGLKGLVSIWSGLQYNSDMYLHEPWLSTIDERIREFLTGTRTDPGIRPPRTDFSEWGDLGFILAKVSEISWVSTDGAAVLQFLGALMSAKALYNLNPIADKYKANLNLAKVGAWAASGGSLRMATVSLDSGLLRYVSEAGEILERDNSTKVQSLGGGAGAPECQEIVSALDNLYIERAALQEDLQGAAPGEKAAIVQQIRAINGQIDAQEAALRECIAANPPTPVPVQISLLDGVIASASIPGIFRPVEIFGETYVDGGIREVLPLEITILQGADTIYAIECSKEAPDYKGPFRESSLLEIVGRALADLSIGEVARDDLRWTDSDDLTVWIIQPTVDLHDATTIDPGLISIGMAYGYMRAADVINGISQQDRLWQVADLMALLRRDTWRLECLANGQPVPTEPAAPIWPADPSLQPEIQARKQQLAGLIAERRQLGGVLPDDAELWPLAPERHPWLTPTRRAEFMSQTTPTSMTPGESRQVAVTMRNSGTVPWTSSGGFKLGSQNPQDNTTWGLNRVDVPAAVGSGSEITFTFNVTAPSSPGTYNFQWQMVQEHVEWFGDATPNVLVEVAVPEPAQCAEIRSQIGSHQQAISELEQSKDGLDPRNPADRREITEINSQIASLRGQIASLQQQATQLGCR